MIIKGVFYDFFGALDDVNDWAPSLSVILFMLRLDIVLSPNDVLPLLYVLYNLILFHITARTSSTNAYLCINDNKKSK